MASLLDAGVSVARLREELAKLASRSAERVCYVVEVCPGCSWNHLVRTFALGLTAR